MVKIWTNVSYIWHVNILLGCVDVSTDTYTAVGLEELPIDSDLGPSLRPMP